MKVLVYRQVKQQEETQAAIQRSARMALAVGICVVGVTAAYSVALYLVAR